MDITKEYLDEFECGEQMRFKGGTEYAKTD